MRPCLNQLKSIKIRTSVDARVSCVSCATLCISEFKKLQYFHLFNQQKSLQIKQKLGTTLFYSTCLKCNNFTVDTCITKRTKFVGLQMFSKDCVRRMFKYE